VLDNPPVGMLLFEALGVMNTVELGDGFIVIEFLSSIVFVGTLLVEELGIGEGVILANGTVVAEG
jgi:hypothetical protein